MATGTRQDMSFPPELLPLGVSSYAEAASLAIEDRELFWSTIGRHRLKWRKDFDKADGCDLSANCVSWFEGGVANVTETCVDKHLGKNKIALIWEKDEPGTQEYVTYEALHERMCRMANCLLSHGIGRGDRVAIYMPTSPDAVAAILACARIGALHSVVFAGFSADSLATRIQSCEMKAVITTDEAVRGGKRIPLKPVVDAAVSDCPCVEHVFVSRRTGNAVITPGRDIDLEEALPKYAPICSAQPMDANDLLFLLYTSGSTGKPKGIGHSVAGYLIYASLTHELVFSYQEGDIHGCVADIGWITGHTYVIYGPLANGATTVLFESVPYYPDPGRYWETVQRLGINQLYTAPTALRMLLKSGDDYVRKYDRSSLKRLGAVGEPLDHEAFHWYQDVVGEGHCDVVDTWWQTETGGIIISPRPSLPGAPIKPAMPMRPFFGIELALLAGGKKEIPDDGTPAEGALYIKQAWPGIARTIWGDHDRFVKTYLEERPGYFYSGDGARRTEEGYYQITGRLDDVINVSGHRLGTAEIEAVIDGHEDVAEAAVVGYPHEIKGEGIYAFVVLMDGCRDARRKKSVGETESEEEIAASKAEVEAQVAVELRQMVRRQLAPHATPDVTLVCPSLPKTRSGKIMRRILRKIATGDLEDLGDITTLADPSVVEAIVQKHKKSAGS